MESITYTKEDYIATTTPYEEVEAARNPFEKEQRITQLADHAKSVGVRNFMTLYKQYVKTMRLMGGKDYVENASNFTDQELELNTGDWIADDYGIMRTGYQGQEECACPHPLLPVQRLNNIDTGIEKVKLAFRRGGVWRHMVCDKRQIASNNLIVGLADYGIAVTSENARYMVRYLHDVENLNYTRIPEMKSVSRLGWVGEEGFSPYVEDLVFDGEDNFRNFFDSVGTKGSMDQWLETVRKIRQSPNLAPENHTCGQLCQCARRSLWRHAVFLPPMGRHGSGENRGTDACCIRVGEPGNGEVHTYLQQHRGGPGTVGWLC